jgi:hypothetical protein
MAGLNPEKRVFLIEICYQQGESIKYTSKASVTM